MLVKYASEYKLTDSCIFLKSLSELYVKENCGVFVVHDFMYFESPWKRDREQWAIENCCIRNFAVRTPPQTQIVEDARDDHRTQCTLVRR